MKAIGLIYFIQHPFIQKVSTKVNRSFFHAEGTGFEPVDVITRHGLASRCITALPTLQELLCYYTSLRASRR